MAETKKRNQMVQLSPELKDKLDEQAKRHGLSQRVIVERALEKAVADLENAEPVL